MSIGVNLASAIGNRVYKNKVRRRGLKQNQTLANPRRRVLAV